jgi:hypothetical protein
MQKTRNKLTLVVTSVSIALMIAGYFFYPIVRDYYSSVGEREVYWVKDADIAKIRKGMSTLEVKGLIGKALATHHWGEKATLTVLTYQTGSLWRPAKLYLYFNNENKLLETEIVVK